MVLCGDLADIAWICVFVMTVLCCKLHVLLLFQVLLGRQGGGTGNGGYDDVGYVCL